MGLQNKWGSPRSRLILIKCKEKEMKCNSGPCVVLFFSSIFPTTPESSIQPNIITPKIWTVWLLASEVPAVSISIVPLKRVSLKLCAAVAKFSLWLCWFIVIQLHFQGQAPASITVRPQHSSTSAHSQFFPLFWWIFVLLSSRGTGVNMLTKLCLLWETHQADNMLSFLMRFTPAMFAWIYSWVTREGKEDGHKSSQLSE